MAKKVFEKAEEHESFGLVGLARWSCGPEGTNLFGSSVRHNHVMSLTIRRARKYRELSRNWYSGDAAPLIEVQMSAEQFAELITTPNVGDGVPCTIAWTEGRQMASCPEISQRQIFQEELEGDLAEALRDVNEIVEEVAQLRAQKKIPAGLAKRIELLGMHLNKNLPFINEQFTRAMDKTTVEAKAEVEGFVEHKLRSLGIEALDSEIARGLSAPAESRALQIEGSK